MPPDELVDELEDEELELLLELDELDELEVFGGMPSGLH